MLNAGKRLPSVEVFKSIYDYSNANLANYNLSNSGHWSSTESITDPTYGYDQGFTSGNILRLVKTQSYNVRCASYY